MLIRGVITVSFVRVGVYNNLLVDIKSFFRNTNLQKVLDSSFCHIWPKTAGLIIFDYRTCIFGSPLVRLSMKNENIGTDFV